jgi:hypothetical protein
MFLTPALIPQTPAMAQSDDAYLVTAEFVEKVPLNTRTIVGPATTTVANNGTTFNIWYEDVRTGSGVGFDDPAVGPDARSRLEDTLRYVASVLNESGELDVVIRRSLTGGGPFLAAAGTVLSGAPGFSNGSAFRRLHNGEGKLFGPSIEEIAIIVDFGHPYYFGTGFSLDPPIPALGDHDFQSLMLHEVTHGLGFLSYSDNTGSSLIPGASKYSVLDSFMKDENGQDVFSGSPPALAVDPAVFTSNNLLFNGINAFSVFGSKPHLFAPTHYFPGSSLNHWRLGFVPNAVMVPVLFDGPLGVRRSYSPVDAAALRDLGWSNTSVVIPPVPPLPNPKTISGQVSNVIDQGIVGVTMTGWPGDDPITDHNGFYEGQVPEFWSGTISPVKTGFIFNPPSRTYSNTTVNFGGQDYLDLIERSLALTAPDGGIDIEHCTDFEITWNSNGILSDSIQIELFLGLFHEILTPSTENDGSHLWTVPETIPTAPHQIRISSVQNPNIADISDGSFGIIEASAPSIVDIRRKLPAARITSADFVLFEVEFSKPVTGVSLSDFRVYNCANDPFLGCSDLVVADAAIASVASADGGAGILWDVIVDTGSKKGLVGIELPDPSGITDACGNTIAEGLLQSPNPDSDDLYNVIEGSRPDIVIGPPVINMLFQTDPPTRNVLYSVSYNGADSVTLSIADVVLNKTGTADATVSVVGGGNHYRLVTLTNITGNGTLGISINAGSASILGGQFANAAGPSETIPVPLPPIPVATWFTLLATIALLLALGTYATNRKRRSAHQ